MNQRCLTILDMLNREETLDVNDLASRLSVSAVTVRKDLAVLENKGLLHRQHGYAMRVSPNDVGYRMTFDYEVKRRIARGGHGAERGSGHDRVRLHLRDARGGACP